MSESKDDAAKPDLQPDPKTGTSPDPKPDSSPAPENPTAENDAVARGGTAGWSGKPQADAAVTQTLAPPLPVEAAAAAEVDAAPAKHKPPIIAPNSGYAVFFFPAALEALGAAIEPFLVRDDGEPHIRCREVDTGGAFIEISVETRAAPEAEASAGSDALNTVELMFPSNMVRLIMSVHSNGVFGFARPPAHKLQY